MYIYIYIYVYHVYMYVCAHTLVRWQAWRESRHMHMIEYACMMDGAGSFDSIGHKTIMSPRIGAYIESTNVSICACMGCVPLCVCIYPCM